MRNWVKYGVLIVFFLSLAHTSYLLFKVDQLAGKAQLTGKASNPEGRVQICINHPPNLGIPCNAQGTQNTTYTCMLNGSDADNASQNITFGTLFLSTHLFTINGTNGLINFTPNSSNIGNHTINFTLEDNSSCSNGKVFELFNLSINSSRNRPPVLVKNISSVTFNEGEIVSAFFLTNHFTDPDGDALTFNVSSQSLYIITISSTGEVVINATTCGQSANVIFTAIDPFNETADSNLVSITCVSPSTTSSTSSSQASSRKSKCLSQFTCFDYTSCSPQGVKTKRCVDENGCRDDEYITVVCKAPEVEKCLDSWSCTSWGECLLNGRQYRTCTNLNGCKTASKHPAEEEPCKFLPSCFDGLKDGDETGIDCGGSCKACLTIETPGFIQEDLKPVTYILFVLTLLGFGLLMANKYYHKQLHHLLVKSGWYLSGRYDKVILISEGVKRRLLEDLNEVLIKMNKGSVEDAFEKVEVLVEDYFKESKVTPRTSPHYNHSKVKKALPGPLESVLDLFYGHSKHLDRKGWPDKDVLRFVVEEFRAIINLTSSAEVKVPYDVKEIKIDEYTHPSEKVRLKMINTWIALQFNEVDLARERYEDLIELYESLDNRSRLSLYSDIYRLYQEIKYANSVLDLEV
ncbi:MAG: hypothetical protein AABX70_01430 [Nanoarchaeota archaeon]